MRRLRPVQECEVIGEFLRNEFYESEYNPDREKFERYVLRPDYSNAEENALRRALLYRRRGHMWRELPSDVVWHESELETKDLAQVRVFPRAHWSRLSNGTYWINDIVERIRAHQHPRGTQQAIAKIHRLRYRLEAENYLPGAVLLIGKGDRHSYTILEGNHRLTAAMLAFQEIPWSRFRVFCGLSERMDECCWYVTNLPNLWRYGKNRLANLHDSEADVQRVLASMRSNHQAEQPLAPAAKMDVENAHKTVP